MFGEYRMGCRNDAKAHIDPRIVCCSDVTVISTPEWDRTRKKTTLWDIPKVNFKYISKQ